MSVVFAFDFGVKKMGVAVGNTDLLTAQPLCIISMDNGQPDWLDLLALIEEWKVTTILVGLPLNIDGSESHLSKRATKFAKRLNHQLKENHTPKIMYMVNEHLTSYTARENVKNHNTKTKNTSKRQQIDDHAACIFLDSWLNEPQGLLLE